MAWEHAFSQHIFDSLVLSEEDVEELRSEKNIKHIQVTSEELEELTVDESLSPYDRLVYVLSDGKDVQKLHAITHMYDIIEGETKPNIEKVLQLFIDVINNQSKDIQIACAKFVLQVSEQRLIHGEKFASLFSKRLLLSVKHKDPEIADEWISALIGSFAIIPKRYIAEIVTFLKSSGSLTQPINIRLLCCKVIAHVSKYVDKIKLQNDLIPVMKSLCQDIDLDVRACMCSQLDVVVPSLGDEVIKDFLLPELSLLLQDEETSVRLVGLETLSNILQTVSPELIKGCKSSLLISKFYSTALDKQIVLELIGCAHYIGEIICSQDVLDGEEKESLMQSYKRLCQTTEGVKVDTMLADGSTNIDDSAKCRYWCAYNFPAVLLNASEEQIRTILLPLFRELIIDTHPTVRKSLACSFHEVANRLTSDVTVLYQCLNTFLVDTDIEVLDGVVNGLPSTLGLIYCSTSVENYVSLLLPTLMECEQFLSKSLRWRVHMKFLQNLKFLTEHVPSDDIQTKLVPLFIAVLNSNKVQPVKLAAGITLLHFLHHNRNVDERNEVCFALTELARSSSKASRILYLDLCRHVAELFSKSFFKENFYNAAMELASDTVVNVRLKFCETLSLLKSQIRLPCDRLLLQTLEQTVRRIMAMENDRDVASSIRLAITDMDCIRLSMDGTPPTEEDVTDREKEDEEEALVEEWNARVQKISPREADRTRSNSCFEARDSKGSFTSNEKMFPSKGMHKTTKSIQKIHAAAKKAGGSGSKTGQSNKLTSSTSSGKISKRCSLPVVKDKRQ